MMYGDQIDEGTAFRQMDRCFEFGIDFLDTAELYTIPPKPETHGDSERIVGKWARTRGVRDRVVLATKVTGKSSLDHIRPGEKPRVTPRQIRQAVEASLARLETDYIDLYQIHWPDREAPMFGSELRGFSVSSEDDSTPIPEQLAALGELVREGKIRHVGLSNETPWGVMQFLKAADDAGLPRIVSVQNSFNLVNRTFEYGLAEIAMKEDVGLLAYSPIGQGTLTGKYLGGHEPAESRRALFGRMGRYQTPAAETAIAEYVGLARELGVDPAILAMQFVTTRPFVTSNIFGASTDAQLDTILASLDYEMTPDVLERVNDIHARLPNPCP
jgi:aryl-alcohol dehydrogenase-like predicted oxidoreductase